MTTTLITGATRGLGRETARQLVAAGHTVWVGARDEARGRAVATELGARSVALDVTDDASVTAALDHIAAEGGLDVLVNNAGIAMYALNGPDALAVFDTNAVGIVRVTEAALPVLRNSANPVVVNVGSALGSFGANHDPSRPASYVSAVVYAASKSAVSMLTVQYARGVHRSRRPHRHLPGGRRRAGLVRGRSRGPHLSPRRAPRHRRDGSSGCRGALGWCTRCGP